MNRSSLRATVLLTLFFPLVALARQLVYVSIFDRTASRTLKGTPLKGTQPFKGLRPL